MVGITKTFHTIYCYIIFTYYYLHTIILYLHTIILYLHISPDNAASTATAIVPYLLSFLYTNACEHLASLRYTQNDSGV
jgi:hypothetical protein